MTKCKYCEKEHKLENTGCNNSGDCNSGYRNSGYRNSGDYNSGYRNSGNYNSGDRNSGDRNSGDYNSGDYNSGDYNSGWFNTNEPKMRFFNKDSEITYSEFGKNVIIYPDLKICAWVKLNDLPKDEQTESAKQMGGLLKTLTYKEAWKEYWDRASDSDKKWFTKLPNFNEKLFEEITGIEIGATPSLKGKKISVEFGGVKYTATID
jgi:hypothetical protein